MTEPTPQLPTAGPDGHPSPLPVMTILLVTALLAALGIIIVARSTVPAMGWVFVGVGILGALYAVLLAVKNVRTSKAIQAREVGAERRAARDAEGPSTD